MLFDPSRGLLELNGGTRALFGRLGSAFIAEPEDVHPFAEAESGFLADVQEPSAFRLEGGCGDAFGHEEHSAGDWADAFASDCVEKAVNLCEITFG